MACLSAVIISIVLSLSYYQGGQLFDGDSAVSPVENLLPYLSNTAGVFLFIMHTSKRKRNNWRVRDYWGDHCFRLAESFAYLFLILWAWAAATNDGSTPVVQRVPPNIIGFMVGLYIVRVERAVEGFGDKFEETITTLLPRATQYVSAEEQRRSSFGRYTGWRTRLWSTHPCDR
jgi:hypothetical protein